MTDWRRLKMLVLNSVSSPMTKRVYNLGLYEFFEWFGRETAVGFHEGDRQRVASGVGRPPAQAVGSCVSAGNWLSVHQAQKLLNTPDASTKKGLRDQAMLAVLLGCGLRRSEVAALTLKHIQQRDGRWCIVDLVGKHGRVRTIPVPTWVKVAIDAWTQAADVAEGHVLQPVNRVDQVQGELSRR